MRNNENNVIDFNIIIISGRRDIWLKQTTVSIYWFSSFRTEEYLASLIRDVKVIDSRIIAINVEYSK